MSTCLICDGPLELHHRAIVLGQHDVSYHWCRQCGLLTTQQPYWLDEAYASVIAQSDTGLVRRSIGLALGTAPLLHHLFGRHGRFVDIGGGYGVYTRIMRDIGFDFYWSDPFCTNLFARGWEADDVVGGPFAAATAFEVLEHVYDPLPWITDCLRRYRASTLVFSTQLYDGIPPAPGTWPYYSELTGQHVSFYTRKTLDTIAEQLGLRAYSHRFLHMLTDQPIRPATYRAITGRLASTLLPLIVARLGSRTVADRDRVLASLAARSVSA